MEQLIELKEFKKGKRGVYTDFTRNLVTWKNNTYKISFSNVNGKSIPYVVLEMVKPLSEIKEQIKAVNRNKEDLKRVEYYVNNNNNTYYVVGIGFDSIKAIRNNEKIPRFFHYFTTEGQYLLEELVKSLEYIEIPLIKEAELYD